MNAIVRIDKEFVIKKQCASCVGKDMQQKCENIRTTVRIFSLKVFERNETYKPSM